MVLKYLKKYDVLMSYFLKNNWREEGKRGNQKSICVSKGYEKVYESTYSSYPNDKKTFVLYINDYKFTHNISIFYI